MVIERQSTSNTSKHVITDASSQLKSVYFNTTQWKQNDYLQ